MSERESERERERERERESFFHSAGNRFHWAFCSLMGVESQKIGANSTLS